MQLKQALLFGLFALTGQATAESGKAEVFGCIHLKSPPGNNYVVDFTAGFDNDSCMKMKGVNQEMQVTKEGVTCISLGQVAADSSLFKCAFNNSYWGLSYQVKGKGTAGSTSTRWTTWGVWTDVKIDKYSTGTVICDTDKPCQATSTGWYNRYSGKIYIIFEPSKLNSLSYSSDANMDL